MSTSESVPEIYSFRVYGPKGRAYAMGTLADVRRFQDAGLRVSDVYQILERGEPDDRSRASHSQGTA